ncbi:hypothetical protein ACHWQZ_G010521 [Mnemiopsis leidyi]
MSSPATVPYGVFLGFVTKNIPPLGFPVTVTHVTGAFWGLVALWTATDFYGADLLVTVLAMVYPAWMSYKAEKSGSYPTQWIAYWIIFAFLYMFEFLQFIVSSIPIYQTFKMALLLWCMFPTENNGAVVLYNGGMKPALAALDNWVNSIKAPVVEFPKDD